MENNSRLAIPAPYSSLCFNIFRAKNHPAILGWCFFEYGRDPLYSSWYSRNRVQHSKRIEKTTVSISSLSTPKSSAFHSQLLVRLSYCLMPYIVYHGGVSGTDNKIQSMVKRDSLYSPKTITRATKVQATNVAKPDVGNLLLWTWRWCVN